MQILNELERQPRGVYTGAVGFLAPGRRAQFNVAIRTAVIDRVLGRVAYGVGSGVVWDSDAAAEYDECLLKARVLSTRHETLDFSLLESLRWTPAEGYFLLDRHLERLAGSAEYFAFPFDQSAAGQALAALAADLVEPSKVRLLLDRRGRLNVEARSLSEGARPEPVRLGLAREPVSSADVFLYHKTTRRGVYETARAERSDCDDVILWNERGELTEASAANIVLALDGQLVTSPVESGLLAGVYRAELLASGEIIERTVTPGDLARADAVWLINSVRGWMAARVVW
jgi:para-aminobenzoate synthetase/4-amino-4-deoxychorismate lyase